MSEMLSAADEAVVQRRRFLRGGALLAAAAGGAVAASATSALPASAATGDPLKLGSANTAGATTALEADGETLATLKLTNTKGATLQLVSYGEDVDGLDLPLGSVVGTDQGPYVSVADEGNGTFLTYLATAEDLASVPTSAPVRAYRIWDSKAKKGTVVAKSSSKAIDSKGRLVKGEWVDLEVAGTDEETSPIGAFLTLASSGSSKDGFFSAYLPGDRPTGTVSAFFLKGKTMSGTAYVGLGVSGRSLTVRVYASQTTYVTVDVSGLTSLAFPGPDYQEPAARKASRAVTRKAAVAQARRAER